jgi:hypothetical protein
MAALSRRAEKLARDWGPREARARAQREAEVEGGRRMTERLEAAVEAEMLRELEARRAEAAMTPEQRNEARLQSLEHPPQAPQPSTNAGRPIGWVLAREAVARRWKREAEEQRERDQRIPERRDKYDAKAQEINAALATATRETHEKHREALQAARDRAANELAELGERPTLQAVAA